MSQFIPRRTKSITFTIIERSNVNEPVELEVEAGVSAVQGVDLDAERLLKETVEVVFEAIAGELTHLEALTGGNSAPSEPDRS